MNDGTLKVVLTSEGEEKLLNYYRQISRFSSFLGTKYYANQKEEIQRIRNDDGSYNLTASDLINILNSDNNYIKEISSNTLTKKKVIHR